MTTFVPPAHLDLNLRQPTDRPYNWRRGYAQRLVVSDFAVLFVALVGVAQYHHLLDEPLVGPSWLDFWTSRGVTYTSVCALVLGGWMVSLAATGSRRYRVIGLGPAEFKAILESTGIVLVFLALVSTAFRIEFSRSFVLTGLSTGFVALVLSRLMWRSWLQGRRRGGDFCSRALIVGSVGPAGQIASELRRHSSAGYKVVGAALTPGHASTHIAGDVPVLGTIDGLIPAVQLCGADTIIVTDGHDLPPAKLRELSWSLEPGRQHLVMAPSLTDIAGPRIHARPVAGLPLVHVETPRYEGADRFVKRAFDITASAVLLIVLSIPLVLTALAIVATSSGGVFFSHERIGKRGRPFKMLKFRSMHSGADARLESLLAGQGTADQPLFKIENDPRITPVGQFLRRYSIDEVPQLINVLRGDMSLVGPRPQVAREVALYNHAATRRLFVKPGMTGLWQVSGRSNLGWDESVRLDLFYVENWSMTTDIMILLKTIRAVLSSDGAV